MSLLFSSFQEWRLPSVPSGQFKHSWNKDLCLPFVLAPSRNRKLQTPVGASRELLRCAADSPSLEDFNPRSFSERSATAHAGLGSLVWKGMSCITCEVRLDDHNGSVWLQENNIPCGFSSSFM